MISLSDYQISAQIHRSANSIVYRGKRKKDNLPVILKVLRQNYPTPTQLTRYKQEYQITHNLALEGVVKAYSLENYQNTLMIIFEDFGGESLRILLKQQPLTLQEFLLRAIAITEALGQVHGANIIHKDINPSNIVYNPHSKQLKIIDFGISTRLDRENQALKNPNLLEGTLAYISPEQTGRMNRPLDYRSDFYSLGVTFYELLTGKLPFESEDSLELIHCHLAKQAVSLEKLPRPNCQGPIPEVISALVIKLMAKTAEERYQSAWGIKADLEECLQQLETTKKIEGFTLATQDLPSRFRIPQQLYGREKEVTSLLEAFERVSKAGIVKGESGVGKTFPSSAAIILVSGYSGIGKSALVKEIYKPITQKKGYFIAGKFAQYQRDIPYYAVIQAFRELIGQLLTETEAQLKQWQDKLQAALGINGQVIIDLIPEVELIIGKQPALIELQPTEAQNRFNLVFQSFIQVFTQPEHPLVLFLDDLQWADLASLKLMQLLVNAPGVNSLLLIGAYRDNEVSAAHPLMSIIKEIKEAGIIINEISLSPLDLVDINRLVADTLHSSEKVTQPLAELLQTKTNGNPFFLREFLKSLQEEKLLQFDFESLSWQGDLGQIQARQITDNVVELMAKKIQKLPERTQRTLKLSSCLGNQFESETLAIIAKTSLQEVVLSLHDALAQGLILPLSDFYKSIELDVISQDFLQQAEQVEYKFVHDRIQQAAYSLIAEEERAAWHLQIGRLLLQNVPLQEQTERIFEIVNQFNQATELITNQSERDELARLNLIAGQKAKASAAYQSGFNYLQVALNLLADNSWQTEYSLTLEVYQTTAEAAYLCGNFEQIEQLTKIILPKVKNPLDKVKIYELIIQSHIVQKSLQKAISKALLISRLFQVNLPENPTNLNLLFWWLKTKFSLRGKDIKNLIDLPEVKNTEKQIAFRIMVSTGTAAYFVNPKLLVLMAMQAVNFSIKYGNMIDSITAYSGYALLCVARGDIDSGYQFGELALKLLTKFDAQHKKASIYHIVYSFIKHWKQHIRDLLNPLLETYQTGLETGNLEDAAYAIVAYSYFSYFAGRKLTIIEKEISFYSQNISQTQQKMALNYQTIYHQLVLNLMNYSDCPYQLTGQVYNAQKMLSIHLQERDIYAIFVFYCNQMSICYLFEVYSQARKNAIEARKYINKVLGAITITIFYFYDSLIKIALFTNSSKIERLKIYFKIKNNQKKLKKWARHAPMNFGHKYYLVEAEKCRVLGQHSQAINLYERAINLAHENEYLNEEALAYELAAKFYLERSNNLIAATYMKQARYCYLIWGAKAKVKQLDEKYPELLATVAEQSPKRNQNSIYTSSKTQQEILDLTTLIKTSQALSHITDLSQLLETLIKFVLENAGAEKGFLILVQGDNLIIQASGTTEEIITLAAVPLARSNNLSQTIINYVYRTQENLVLNNASSEGLFISDEYIRINQIKAVLCLPILNRGKLLGILYLENNLAENVFTAERLEVLKLISAQAAISIENALLRQQEREKVFEYQVGGCLTINSPTYVIRQADLDLYQNLKQGHYCYILNSRHMGKSSLRVRIMNKLQREGIVCGSLDLTSIGSKNITVEQWYAGVIYSLVNSLKLSNKFNFRNWWRSLDFLSPVQKFSEFIEQVLLREIRGQIIIFIDEIDSTLSLNFNLDDFFAVIRACYNNRGDNPEYQRLIFVLIGVATPSSLVQDKNCTPFNIGKAISLQGFQLHEVKPLIRGLASKYQNPQALIKQVLAWTGGQPFLTQKICNLMVDAQIPLTEAREAEWVENLVRAHIIDSWESKDDPQHLKTIRDRLLNSSNPTKLLQLYQQIWHQEDIIADDSSEHKELLLSGLVRLEGRKFKVYNRIYQSVFDTAWCERLGLSLYT